MLAKLHQIVLILASGGWTADVDTVVNGFLIIYGEDQDWGSVDARSTLTNYRSKLSDRYRYRCRQPNSYLATHRTPASYSSRNRLREQAYTSGGSE
jgi:hypothetical protein